MDEWRYGDAGDRFPVAVGDVWQVGAHVLACGDLEMGAGSELARRFACRTPEMALVDPPWSAGNARAFRTKAGVSRAVDYAHLLDCLFMALRTISGLIAIEMGRKSAEVVMVQAQARGLLCSGIQPMRYYRSKPCLCIGLSHLQCYPLFEQLPCADERVVYRWLIEHFSESGAIVFDPCVGRGMTALEAHRQGRIALGLELHPRRLAATIEQLTQAGAGKARKIGALQCMEESYG